MDSARELFKLPGARVHISVVSWWEIAIKVRAEKLHINIPELELYVGEYDFINLPLTRDCIKVYLKLPNLHKDPFDHMLLAQAKTGSLRLITGDSILAKYYPLVTVI